MRDGKITGFFQNPKKVKDHKENGIYLMESFIMMQKKTKDYTHQKMQDFIKPHQKLPTHSQTKEEIWFYNTQLNINKNSIAEEDTLKFTQAASTKNHTMETLHTTLCLDQIFADPPKRHI